MPLW
jgi:hypothetical protein